MNKFAALISMQLKDKIDLTFLKSKKQTIFKVVFSVLKFVIITAIIYLAFYVLSYLRLISLLPGIPTQVISIVFFVVFMLSIIITTNRLKTTLYEAKDNFILLDKPIAKNKIFWSKIIVFFIYEVIKNFYFFAPLIFAFYLINNVPIWFYFWIIISTIFYTIFVISISALLSIPWFYLSNIISRKKYIKYTVIIVSILSIILLLVMLILSIPTNFDLIGNWGTTFWKIQDFVSLFNNVFVWFYVVTLVFFGERYGVSNMLLNGNHLIKILIMLTITIIMLTITNILIKPIYFKFASKNFEFNKNIIEKSHKNYLTNQTFSIIKLDVLLSIRNSKKFYSILVLVIALPLSILLLNKIYSAMDTRLAGTYMSIAFNVLLILLILLSSNSIVASIFSDDGSAIYHNKISPISYTKILTLRLIFMWLVNSISLAITVIILSGFINLSIFDFVIIFCCLDLLYSGHLLYSAELDIMNSYAHEFAATGLYVNNKNITKSVITSFVISALFSFLTYFFMSENSFSVWLKLLFIASVYFAYRVYLYVSKIQVYYKEL